jgi:4-hydroxy-3-methylbut-2-enyl diphosphate reductase
MGEAPLVTQVVGSPEEVTRLQVPDPNRVAFLTQTTLSLDETKDIIAALRERFPNITGPHAQDICYATENRQVVGSDNSSNSNRLVEVARNLGRESHLIDSFRNIRPEWLNDVNTIALTAGASAPECLVEEVVKFLAEKGFGNVQEVEVMPENVRFGLPPEIVEAIASAPATSASAD